MNEQNAPTESLPPPIPTESFAKKAEHEVGHVIHEVAVELEKVAANLDPSDPRDAIILGQIANNPK